jgi:MFS transporter, MHS family, proline/betaine transporter
MMAMATALTDQTAPAPHWNLTVLAGAIGNVLEWYDFAAYGFLAQSFARNFFPLNNALMSLLASYGVFAVAFLMRPLGGVVFGHIGDRIGRRAALLLSVVAMAIPSFAIGLLPTYATAGILAPIVLILLRSLQGLSVGGELTISIVYLGEQSDHRNRGLGASWTFFGSMLGALCGSLAVGLLNTVLGHEAIADWGWRLPFLGSGVIGLTALGVRYAGMASGLQPPAHAGNAPIVVAFVTEWRTMIAAYLFCVPSGVVYYIGLIYLTAFVHRFDAVPAAESDYIVSLGMITMLVGMPLFAALSDRIGRKTVMLCGAVGLMLYAWPMFWLVTQQKTWMAFVAEIGFAICDSAYAAPLPAMLAMQFRPDVRCTAASLSYNTAMATFGGTAPMIAVYLIARTGYTTAPAWFMAASAAAGFAGLLLAKGDEQQA